MFAARQHVAAVFSLVNGSQTGLLLPVELLFVFGAEGGPSLIQHFLGLDDELFFGHWTQELERHLGSLPELGLAGDVAIQALRNFLTNAEAQSVAPRIKSPRHQVVGLEVWLEKVAEVGSFDANAIVLDADLGFVEAKLPIEHALNLHDDDRVFWTELNCVGQEVYNDLLRPVQIHPHNKLKGQRLQLYINVLGMSLLAHNGHNVCDHSVDGAVLEVGHKAVVFKQTLVKHQLHLTQYERRRERDQLRIPALVRVNQFPVQRLCETDDALERCQHLMVHCGLQHRQHSVFLFDLLQRFAFRFILESSHSVLLLI